MKTKLTKIQLSQIIASLPAINTAATMLRSKAFQSAVAKSTLERAAQCADNLEHLFSILEVIDEMNLQERRIFSVDDRAVCPES